MKRNMRTRHTAITIAITALTLAGCSSNSGSDGVKASSTPRPAAKPAGLTAKQAAAKLADATGVTTLGHPTDNTASCSNKAAGKAANGNDCVQLITTDTVSIYQFPSPKVAAHWVKGMKSAGDWRQVNSFALAFTARDQHLTSDERRDELVAALTKITT